MKNINIELNKNNKKLTNILKSLNINKLIITVLGNSISTGYSYRRTTKPLLERNESLEKELKNNNIILEKHIFARPRNNSDEHTLEWLINNTKQSEINKIIKYDLDERTGLKTNGLTEEEKNTYFPNDIKDDKGLKDIIYNYSNNDANIIIYNGATGSFLDNIYRKGKIKNKFMYGVKRDIKTINAFLTLIQINNRFHKSKTQVYLCGAPNILNISFLINNK